MMESRVRARTGEMLKPGQYSLVRNIRNPHMNETKAHPKERNKVKGPHVIPQGSGQDPFMKESFKSDS